MINKANTPFFGTDDAAAGKALAEKVTPFFLFGLSDHLE
jgi:hypothetical protein